MNLAPSPVAPTLARGRAGRVGCALVGAALFVLGTAPGAGAATLTTNGLRGVRVSSYQALPPPYKPGHAVLKSAASLRAFEHAVRADHIGTTLHPTTANGCAGGIQYTVVMTYNKGRHPSLAAYDCGGSVTGNMTGNVKKFVGYLSSLIT